MSATTALAVVQAAQKRGALIFANMENMEAKVELYRTEVTEIHLKDADFHVINKKKVPNKAATDRIGEACGIQFIQAACRVTTEQRDDPTCGKRTVYCAEAQGKVRMPDGSWRTSTVDDYEFDPVLRAMLDKNVTELTPQTRPTVARLILEYTKVARQRAATGARLRVIKQLTGMTGAFDEEESKKPFVFTRVVQNTDYILKTPEGRVMATAQALGCDVSSLLYGDKKALPENTTGDTYVHAETVDASAADAAEDDVDFPAGENDAPAKTQEQIDFEELSYSLDQYMSAYKDTLNIKTPSGVNPFELAMNELNNPNATIESRKSMIDRVRTFLIGKRVPGVV